MYYYFNTILLYGALYKASNNYYLSLKGGLVNLEKPK